MERVDRVNKQPATKADARRQKRRVGKVKVKMAKEILLNPNGIINSSASLRDVRRLAEVIVLG